MKSTTLLSTREINFNFNIIAFMYNIITCDIIYYVNLLYLLIIINYISNIKQNIRIVAK